MQWRYGIDLRDLYRPGGGPSRLTRRRLWVLVRGLPPDSATRARMEQGPNSGPPYTLVNYQLADVIDELSSANWQRANEGVPPHKQSKRPAKYPRPATIRAANELAVSRKQKLEELRERAAKRKELIASGVIA